MSDIDTIQPAGYEPQKSLSFGLRVFIKLMKSSPLVGEAVTPEVTRLLSSYSAVYIAPVGEGKYVLFDTGFDSKATEIVRYLKAHGATEDDVVAVFLTHGHPDHLAGLPHFARAAVYVSAGDRAFVEGKTKADGLFPSLSGKLKSRITPSSDRLQTVQDDEVVVVGDKQIRCFLIPGHTRGSMAYLLNGALIVGDALTYDSHGRALKPPAPMSYSSQKGIESLRLLIERLESESITSVVVLPSHSGSGTLDAIRDLVAKLRH